MNAAAHVPPDSTPRHYSFAEIATGYAFILPFLAIFIVFIGFPVVYSFWLSLHETTLYTDWYNRFNDMGWVGFDHYKRILTFQDSAFWLSLALTFGYALVTIPLGIALSLALALLLRQRLKGAGIFRTGFFLPNVFDMFVVGTIWLFLLNPNDGLIRNLINAIGEIPTWIGLPGFAFPEAGLLGNPWLCLPAIGIAMVLKGAGFGMILFLTAIANLNESVLEAAEVDGCGPWRKLRYVILPQVKPTILFLVTTGLIGSLNAFTEVFAMTPDGGPTLNLGDGLTIAGSRVSGYHLYRIFEDNFYGQAAATSFCLLGVALVVSAFNFYFLTPRD